MNHCNCCERIVTWAEAKKQYGRGLHFGYTEEIMKRISPLCSKCLTKYFKNSREQAKERAIRVKLLADGYTVDPKTGYLRPPAEATDEDLTGKGSVALQERRTEDASIDRTSKAQTSSEGQGSDNGKQE